MNQPMRKLILRLLINGGQNGGATWYMDTDASEADIHIMHHIMEPRDPLIRDRVIPVFDEDDVDYLISVAYAHGVEVIAVPQASSRPEVEPTTKPTPAPGCRQIMADMTLSILLEGGRIDGQEISQKIQKAIEKELGCSVLITYFNANCVLV